MSRKRNGTRLVMRDNPRGETLASKLSNYSAHRRDVAPEVPGGGQQDTAEPGASDGQAIRGTSGVSRSGLHCPATFSRAERGGIKTDAVRGANVGKPDVAPLLPAGRSLLFDALSFSLGNLDDLAAPGTEWNPRKSRGRLQHRCRERAL